MTIIVLLLLAMATIMLGCTSARDPIIGSWGNDQFSLIGANVAIITFNTDGTCDGALGVNQYTNTGSTWKALGNNKYVMTNKDGKTTEFTLKNDVIMTDSGLTFHPVPAGTTINPTATPNVWSPTTKSVSLGFGRSNPAPIGTTIYSKSTAVDGTTYNDDTTLTQVVRGEQAWQMIKSANMFNEAPDAGKEYLLAKFKINVRDSSDQNKPMNINPTSIYAISGNGVTYDQKFVVEPEPQLSSALYSGGSTEGWVSFQVNQGDSNPYILYGNYYTGEGIWFKT